MSDSYLAVGRVWELCGEDTVSDNDTSGIYYSSVDKSIAAAKKNFIKFYENL